jgi:hypothetical protein
MKNWKSDFRHARGGVFLSCLLLFLSTLALGGESNPERCAFSLEEVPGFDDLNLGHTCGCRSEPEPNVVYPAFSSGKPLYGVMPVDMEFANPRSGTPYQFALDESGGTGTGYDRLYLDRNRDGRLSDEVPITPLRELPPGALFKQKWVAPPVWFGYVTFSSTDAAGTHSVETLPRLLINVQGQATLSFTATKARKGEIEIAQRRFNVTILNGYPLGTRWDRPGTIVKLQTRGGMNWFGPDRLMALHKIGDRYWHLSMTPAGDRFFVEPYEGRLGVLQIDAGGWPFRRTTFSGALLARDKAVAVGQDDGRGHYRFARSCEVPVGDYTPVLLDVRCGPLAFGFSNNGYTDGMAGDPDPNAAYTLRIRPDRPCVLGLSRKATILFASPARGTRLKPGDNLQVTAVLVDPKSNAMIRALRRQPREEESRTSLALIGFMIVAPLGVWIAFGKSRQQYRYLPLFSGIGLLLLVGYLGGLFALNALLHPGQPGAAKYEDLTPRVTITRSNGEIVAEGAMPFG